MYKHNLCSVSVKSIVLNLPTSCIWDISVSVNTSILRLLYINDGILYLEPTKSVINIKLLLKLKFLFDISCST